MIFNRKVAIHWVLNQTAFEIINKKSLISFSRPIGNTVEAANKMIRCSEEMELLLPDIIGVTPNSSTDKNSWHSAVANYWHNFNLEVSEGGNEFNTSMIFDMYDYRRKKYIDELVKQLDLDAVKVIPATEEGKHDETIAVYTEEEKIKKFAEYVMSNVPEELKYRYCTPVDVSDYFAWRYCLVNSFVGNDPDVIVKDDNSPNKEKELKSTRIRFYLIDEQSLNARKKKIQDTKNQAVEYFGKLISEKDNSRLENILITLDKISDLNSIKALSDSDKQSLIMEVVVGNPSKFISVYESKSLNAIAEVKKFVIASLIRKLDNSNVYVDSSDPTIVLGNTIAEVVSYLASTKNAAYKNELVLKYKSLVK